VAPPYAPPLQPFGSKWCCHRRCGHLKGTRSHVEKIRKYPRKYQFLRKLIGCGPYGSRINHFMVYSMEYSWDNLLCVPLGIAPKIFWWYSLPQSIFGHTQWWPKIRDTHEMVTLILFFGSPGTLGVLQILTQTQVADVTSGIISCHWAWNSCSEIGTPIITVNWTLKYHGQFPVTTQFAAGLNLRCSLSFKPQS